MTPGEPTKQEIEEQLAKLLSHPILAKSERLSTLLTTIVRETIAGNFGALKEVSLAADVYGKTDYDPRNNARVRVDANNIRTRLNAYYTNDGAGDPVVIDLPRGRYVAEFRHRTKSASIKPKRNWKTIAAVSAAALALSAFAIRYAMLRPAFSRVAEPAVQITSDGGFTGDPSVSDDGGTLVYASDRGGGSVHVWVKSGNAAPRQLTFGDFHDFWPEVSPDGRRVAFRSLRQGNGIYVVPIEGGEPARVTSTGYFFRWSPDSSRLAYAAGSGAAGPNIYTVGANGTEPRRVDRGIVEANCPVWTPDGQSVLFIGRDSIDADWNYWLAADTAVAAQQVVRPVDMRTALKEANLHPLSAGKFDCPQGWMGSRLLFRLEGADRDGAFQGAVSGSRIFYTIPLTPPNWSIAGRVTPVDPPFRSTKLRAAKTNVAYFPGYGSSVSIWTADLPTGRGDRVTQAEDPRRQVQDQSIQEGFVGTWPALSQDGNILCINIEKYSNPSIVCKDLTTNLELQLQAKPKRDSPVFLSKDGSRAGFLASGNQGRMRLLEINVRGGGERVVTEDCPILMEHSWDQDAYLCQSANEKTRDFQLYRVEAATGKRSRILESKLSPQAARVSPDGRWLAYVEDIDRDGLLAGSIAPLTQLGAGNRTSWIRVTEEPYNLSLHWSPDGNYIYYWKVRDGFRCLWGQRVDHDTAALLGEPFAVLHRHRFQAYPNKGGTLAVGGTPGRLRFAMTLEDTLSEIWRAHISN